MENVISNAEIQLQNIIGETPVEDYNALVKVSLLLPVARFYPSGDGYIYFN